MISIPRWTSLGAAIVLAASTVPLSGQGFGRGSVTLPDGPGKDLVQSTCTTCHALGLIAVNSFTREDWPSALKTMVDLPADKTAVITDYLARNFPARAKPTAATVPGPVKVSFKE